MSRVQFLELSYNFQPYIFFVHIFLGFN